MRRLQLNLLLFGGSELFHNTFKSFTNSKNEEDPFLSSLIRTGSTFGRFCNFLQLALDKAVPMLIFFFFLCIKDEAVFVA